jgi:hypothetical protein
MYYGMGLKSNVLCKCHFNTAHWRCPNVTRGVSHYVALPFTVKSILRQKKKLWKLEYFTMKKYDLEKIL